jgi:hypothetical protein
MVRNWLAEWEDYLVVPEQLFDWGDRIVVRATVSARGRHSRAEVGMNMGHCFSLTDGQVSRWDAYRDWSDCVEVHGLDDPTMSPVSVLG